MTFDCCGVYFFFRDSFPCNSEEAFFKGRGAWENRTRRIDSVGNFDCGAYWNRLPFPHRETDFEEGI